MIDHINHHNLSNQLFPRVLLSKQHPCSKGFSYIVFCRNFFFLNCFSSNESLIFSSQICLVNPNLISHALKQNISQRFRFIYFWLILEKEKMSSEIARNALEECKGAYGMSMKIVYISTYMLGFFFIVFLCNFLHIILRPLSQPRIISEFLVSFFSFSFKIAIYFYSNIIVLYELDI